MSSKTSSRESMPQPLVDNFEQPRDPILSPEDGLLVVEQLWRMQYALNPEALRCSRQPIPEADFVL